MTATRFVRDACPSRLHRLWAGAALRVFRNRAAWTQADLARRIGVSDTTWSRFEQGSLPIPAELLPRIESLLDLPVSSIERACAELRFRTRDLPGTSSWRFRKAKELLGDSPTLFALRER